MDKTKLLVADNMTVATVLQLIKTNLKINETTSIYILVSNKNIMLSGAQTIISIYQEYKNEDGFLYLEYCTENVFG
jgi:GABA(A) receptor-associated protein